MLKHGTAALAALLPALDPPKIFWRHNRREVGHLVRIADVLVIGDRSLPLAVLRAAAN